MGPQAQLGRVQVVEEAVVLHQRRKANAYPDPTPVYGASITGVLSYWATPADEEKGKPAKKEMVVRGAVVTPPEEVREGGKFHARAFQIDLDPRHAGQSKAAARSRLLLALEQPRKLEAWIEAYNGVSGEELQQLHASMLAKAATEKGAAPPPEAYLAHAGAAERSEGAATVTAFSGTASEVSESLMLPARDATSPQAAEDLSSLEAAAAEAAAGAPGGEAKEREAGGGGAEALEPDAGSDGQDAAAIVGSATEGQHAPEQYAKPQVVSRPKSAGRSLESDAVEAAQVEGSKVAQRIDSSRCVSPEWQAWEAEAAAQLATIERQLEPLRAKAKVHAREAWVRRV
ncbi:hypothetical protein EMIHUDRAFT_243833 [Emiliania huxleyi CCMP1516]|uniref:Plus3 domain-containing protein n=2 Tax=Emiliania huxleyi TaxID=2903 RepID=A0A0D3J2F0_EMIH1|nr:hypothetical protein EMIHUDRAFT_243833 [Emiliania huxleyi CCMP1516]EOD17685.1 hypothetical protein EMIHUDRAFT_243833 [Emiliania huxleyi CCMP1516]|eukprot:XP_005770114.1 hypothetical protein EMIHUDRAFT_243833 [Emiliania huxleyi CCMP1516]